MGFKKRVAKKVAAKPPLSRPGEEGPEEFAEIFQLYRDAEQVFAEYTREELIWIMCKMAREIVIVTKKGYSDGR